jgi:hypothetical protein
MERFAAGSKLRTAAVGIAAAAMLVLAGCQPVQTRDDFKGAVMSKTPAEVQTRLGKPDAIDESDPAKVIWIYHGATFDLENNNKRDPQARVIFNRQETARSVVDVQFGS